MTVRLTDLPDGNVALEFDATGHSAVNKAIREIYGSFSQDRAIDRAAIEFGGETFIYQYDVPERSLTAGSEKGCQMLRSLYDLITD